MFNEMSTNRFRYIVIIPLLIITGLIIIQNFTFLEKPRYTIIGIIVLFILSYLLLYKLNITVKIMLPIIMIFSFLLRLIFIIKIKTPIESDFSVMYNAALNASRNDFSAFQSGYFQTWAYQTPFVLYEALLLRLFGNPFAIEFINVIFMVGTNLLIYFIVKLIVNEKVALIIALLYAFYPAPIFFSSLLTNQHISTFFIYLMSAEQTEEPHEC